MNPDESILRAIEILNGASQRIVLVVNEKNKLRETVTDDDIRRGLIKRIESFINDKLRAIGLYATEKGIFPFSRSYESTRSLTTPHCAAYGVRAVKASSCYLRGCKLA